MSITGDGGPAFPCSHDSDCRHPRHKPEWIVGVILALLVGGTVWLNIILRDKESAAINRIVAIEEALYQP